LLGDYTDFSGFLQRFLAISLANQECCSGRGFELVLLPGASLTFRHLASAALRARSLAAGVPRIEGRGRCAIATMR
jgi:hypothetical protein